MFRIDLRSDQPLSKSQVDLVLNELMLIFEDFPADQIEIVATGDLAFAARLSAPAGARVTPHDRATRPIVEFRGFGEACPASLGDWPTLVEPHNLGPLLDGEEGPAARQETPRRRLHELSARENVVWRVASKWQAGVLRDILGIARARIITMPAKILPPPMDDLANVVAHSGLEGPYFLCLTPVGAEDMLPRLIEAHGRLGPAAPSLVILGIDETSGLPAARDAVGRAGSNGRVSVLRDLDALSEVTAIARAAAVVAIEQYPSHATRLRQAARFNLPAAIYRHAGHSEWVEGGAWFDNRPENIVDALRSRFPIRSRDNADNGLRLGEWALAAVSD